MKPSDWAWAEAKRTLEKANFSTLYELVAKLAEKSFQRGVNQGRLAEYRELREKGLLKGKEPSE